MRVDMLSTVPLSSQQIFARHFLLRAKVPHVLACFCYCSCGEIDRMDIAHWNWEVQGPKVTAGTGQLEHCGS